MSSSTSRPSSASSLVIYALAAKQPPAYRAPRPILNTTARGGALRPRLVLSNGYRLGQDELARPPRVWRGPPALGLLLLPYMHVGRLPLLALALL
jgi:hypothetical protein